MFKSNTGGNSIVLNFRRKLGGQTYEPVWTKCQLDCIVSIAAPYSGCMRHHLLSEPRMLRTVTPGVHIHIDKVSTYRSISRSVDNLLFMCVFTVGYQAFYDKGSTPSSMQRCLLGNFVCRFLHFRRFTFSGHECIISDQNISYSTFHKVGDKILTYGYNFYYIYYLCSY